MYEEKIKSKYKKIYIIVAVVVAIAYLSVIGYFISITNENTSRLDSYPRITTMEEFEACLNKPFNTYIVLNAPLSGTAISDPEGILTADNLLYVYHTLEECTEYSEYDSTLERWVTDYKWVDVREFDMCASDDICAYGQSIKLRGSDTIDGERHKYYYPNGNGGTYDGNTRYCSKYITTNDTVSFVGVIGNGTCTPFAEVFGIEYFINSSPDIFNKTVNRYLGGIIFAYSFSIFIICLLVFPFIKNCEKEALKKAIEMDFESMEEMEDE